MSLAKALDVESVRFSAPDLCLMRSFLADFGLRKVEDTGDGVLRMRGTGTAQFLHETVEGPPRFEALSLRVSSMDDLDALAAAEGTSVEEAVGPGGGATVKMRDPDGYQVEAIFGCKPRSARETPESAQWNVVSRRDRMGTAKRIQTAPAHVMRLGHVVLGASNVEETWVWWREHFGLLVSDEVRAADGNLAAIFIRCDRGAEAVDHHTLNFASIPGVAPKFYHAAFEVLDLDDLMAGNRYLADRDYQHDWGIGRHYIGSQVFDYWKDPLGHRVEHWTDGDLFDATAKANVTDVSTMLGRQWGPEAPADFAV